MAEPMAEPTPAAKHPPATPAPARRPGVPLRALLPLVLCWLAALFPVALWLLDRRDPELAVEVAWTTRLWALRAASGAAAVGLLALLFYPPFPAWLRRTFERTRTRWSLDRTPLLRALSELQHLETAQRHLEVARLAWQRDELALVGPHVQRAVELDPGSAPALHLFGLFLLRVGEPRGASAAFAAAERSAPGHAFGDALLHAARAAFLAGDDHRALLLFAQHEREHGGAPRAHYWHGEALLLAGRRDEARAAFAAAAVQPRRKLTAEENWFRALARVKVARLGGAPRGDGR